MLYCFNQFIKGKSLINNLILNLFNKIPNFSNIVRGVTELRNK
jgi:hypothetical protein